jgi:hypothetical protein
MSDGEDIHCDEVINNVDYPECLRNWLKVHRSPAIKKSEVNSELGNPQCFATFNGNRFKLVMASRFGDVGITKNLAADNGYEYRVSINRLSDFSENP